MTGGDEKDCRLLDFDRENYQVKYAPRHKNGSRLQLGVGFEIFEMDKIDLQQLSFELSFDIYLFWNEPRIDRLYNLRKDWYSNKISNIGAKGLWIPRLEFKNSKERIFVTYDDESSDLWVNMDQGGNSTPAGIDEFNEARIFPVDQSTLVLVKSYKMAFKCDYQLIYYPFDKQHCFIQVCVLCFSIQSLSAD